MTDFNLGDNIIRLRPENHSPRPSQASRSRVLRLRRESEGSVRILQPARPVEIHRNPHPRIIPITNNPNPRPDYQPAGSFFRST